MKGLLKKIFTYCYDNNQAVPNQEVSVSCSPIKINKNKNKDPDKSKPKRCISSNHEFYRHSHLYSIQDSFTQFSQVSLNDNHYYQELNYPSLDQEVICNKMLIIEDIEGDLFNNKKLFIDAIGLKNTIRGKKDGFSFFGSITHYKGKVINDYVLNLNNEIMTNIKVKIYFAVYYDRSAHCFFFKNVKKIDYYTSNQLNMNYIVLCRIDKKEMMLLNRHLFQLGMGYMISIEILNEHSLKINAIGRNGIVENSYMFQRSDSPISIGKEGKVHLEKKDKMTMLTFNKEEQYWLIKDKNDEIWMVCDRKIELKNNHRFKLDKDVFEINATIIDE